MNELLTPSWWVLALRGAVALLFGVAFHRPAQPPVASAPIVVPSTPATNVLHAPSGRGGLMLKTSSKSLEMRLTISFFCSLLLPAYM